MVFNRYRFPKRKLALVIPAHNEELVIEGTIRSAIAAGQHPADIFVVADGCSDRTAAIARSYLSARNILAHRQSGKAMSIRRAVRRFQIKERYEWLHIADADGRFSPTYFHEVNARLSNKYVAATGYVQSLPGGLISRYRTFEYFVGLEIVRRVQVLLGVVSVIPGPTSMFRTDTLDKLDFTAGTLTEDMDVTIQIHRQKLGRIAFIPQAKTFTQDPKDISDYVKQVSRWYRGTWQVMLRHRIGLRPQRIDGYLSYAMIEQVIFLTQIIFLPLVAWWGQSYGALGVMFLSDLIIFLFFTVCAAVKCRRPDVLAAFPMFYVLRVVNLSVFVKSWFEIVVQRKFRTGPAGWSTAGRRYRIATEAAVTQR